MRRITKTEFYEACERTVEQWDMDTLIEYATETMYARNESSPYVVLTDDGAFFDNAQSMSAAMEIADHYGDLQAVRLEAVKTEAN